jgi:hypothetical protein
VPFAVFAAGLGLDLILFRQVVDDAPLERIHRLQRHVLLVGCQELLQAVMHLFGEFLLRAVPVETARTGIAARAAVPAIPFPGATAASGPAGSIVTTT